MVRERSVQDVDVEEPFSAGQVLGLNELAACREYQPVIADLLAVGHHHAASVSIVLAEARR